MSASSRVLPPVILDRSGGFFLVKYEGSSEKTMGTASALRIYFTRSWRCRPRLILLSVLLETKLEDWKCRKQNTVLLLGVQPHGEWLSSTFRAWPRPRELIPGDPNGTDAVTESSAALWDAALVNHHNSLNIYCLIQTMFSILDKHWTKIFPVQIILIMACDNRILNTKINH